MNPLRSFPLALATCLSLAVAGCSTPGGASTATVEPSTYQVQVPAITLAFQSAVPEQDGPGITAILSTRDLVPELYYRYQVQEQVNGNYLYMPAPPKVYVIRKLPFFQNDPESMSVHIHLKSGSQDVIRTGQAVCSFDINGRTVSSTPLKAADLLPGHELDIDVDGPSLDAFATAPSGTLTVWLYGLNGADKDKTYHWDLQYSYKDEQRQVEGAVLGQTNSKQEADEYQDRVDRADGRASGGP